MRSTQVKAPKSLQKTLGIGLTVGVTLLWLLALLSTVYVSQNKLNTLFDSALAETAQRIMPLAVVEITNREEPGQLQQIMSFETHDEPLVYLVRDASGAILLKSHNADPLMFNKTLLKGGALLEKDLIGENKILYERLLPELKEVIIKYNL